MIHLLTTPRSNVHVLSSGDLAVVNKEEVENDCVESKHGKVNLEVGPID